MDCKNAHHFMYLDIEGRCPYCKEEYHWYKKKQSDYNKTD